MMQRRFLTIILLALIFMVGTGGVVAKASVARKNGKNITSDQRPYTIMIYMNGSDLESEFGAATDDLVEMLDSGLNSQNASVIILTGGAKKWQNDAIPETECVIWELADGFLNELETMGNANMGNPNTLRDFVKFSMSNYPAQRYGLIMWNHGGGSIAGFGHDEKFADGSLTLLEMKKAFDEAGLAENKLEFLGFDACLMATVEMAILASNYARVLIASEDLEPGEGWDYHFLSALNKNPNMNGFDLGKIIVDSFMDFFPANGLHDEILTLSVIDLQRVAPVMEAMGRLMAHEISEPKFKNLAIRRAHTKTFGEGSPRDNYADMVDIGDMAVQLQELYPHEAKAILLALKKCVTYNRHNSDVPLYGLSTFYIYGGKSQGVPSLRTYSNLEMDSDYTQFLHHFFDRLIRINREGSEESEESENIRTELVLWKPMDDKTFRMVGLLNSPAKQNLLWPSINDHPVCLFPASTTENARRYAVPAKVNNRDADIIILFNQQHPKGRILGIRYNAGNVFQKGYDPISEGDEIAFYYLEHDFNNSTNALENTPENWQLGETFTVSTQPSLSWAVAPTQFKQGYRHTDICHSIIYTTPF
ncbi:MAG: clostripain-related cysteine peptidase [Defluviitaleaceae bacterium]|nr:clostripain-related cysteine peptidase [Defluviitaleaceae bacterium]